ncbi:MAG: hypothetical protein QQW96_08020 [Tychonema bourrellyi B0820]|uniref:hypothetical protein n=1 Tax=Tychonema bourrellyi TaxID=54313 RepID=UPI0015D48706|nr:hypothetical protein [Tychonema bourrellyi]MDQ2097577.1 hypothetical protein [Tychonema bourrellyi B0820]
MNISGTSMVAFRFWFCRTSRSQRKAKKTSEIVKLSHLNTSAAMLLSAMFPICGYIYTRRWLSCLGFLLGGLAVFTTVYITELEQDKTDSMIWTFCALYGSTV